MGDAERTLDVETDHNVYVLGAGFSATVGYPVLPSFLERVRRAKSWLQTHHPACAAAIDTVLRFRNDSAASAERLRIDLENIEDLFSLASLARTADKSLIDAINKAIAGTIVFCQENRTTSLCHIKGKSSSPCSYLERLGNSYEYNLPVMETIVGIMIGAGVGNPSTGARNTIITFNYDLEIENALRGLRVPWTYKIPGETWSRGRPFEEWEPSSPNLVELLKLHGSINWTLSSDDQESESIELYDSYSLLAQNGKTPFLIPPTWEKTSKGPLAGPWKAAQDAIRTATRLIVVGYSIPETDVHFKYLLGSGLVSNVSLDKVIIVNPALENIQSSCSKLFRSELIEQGRLEYAQFKTRGFFLYGENDHRGIRYVDPDEFHPHKFINRPMLKGLFIR